MKDLEEDSQLVNLSQSGDMDAFSQLVRKHEGWIRAWLRSKLQDWTAADDLAQETFVTAFKKIKKLNNPNGLEPWLRQIALNHFRNHIRKRREHYIGGDLELQNLLLDDNHTDSLITDNATFSALEECLENLNNSASQLLNEHYKTGKTLREISKEKSIGYSSLTMKFHRIRQSLGMCIEGKINY